MVTVTAYTYESFKTVLALVDVTLNARQVFYIATKIQTDTQPIIVFRVLGVVATQQVAVYYDSNSSSDQGEPPTFFADFPKAIAVDNFS